LPAAERGLAVIGRAMVTVERCASTAMALGFGTVSFDGGVGAP